MVWGVFSLHYLGSTVRVLTSLNAIRYEELLDDHLHPFMLFCYMHCNGDFQQDHCTSHKCPLATDWLYEHFSHFSVINWPPRILKLNYIELLGNVLEQGIEGHHIATMNLIELWTGLANIWHFQKFVKSIRCLLHSTLNNTQVC
ncbi:transposable element Tcb2 transposase [Trichonephila clavipes]|nr:transposable element Tcb2 transposase [Trichonephila clavipes]